jgi:hypothetical protein
VVLVVNLVHAMTVRLAHLATATHVRVATLVQTVRPVHSVLTAMAAAQTA